MKSLREQLDKCRHFTGVGSDCKGNPIRNYDLAECAAHVRYKSVRRDGFELPCFHEGSFGEKPRGECDKCSFKSPKELDVEVAEHKAHTTKLMAKLTVVRPAIMAHAKAHGYANGNGVSDFIDCPACKTGRVRYSVSGYNGHVHAHCSTSGCVSWME